MVIYNTKERTNNLIILDIRSYKSIIRYICIMRLFSTQTFPCIRFSFVLPLDFIKVTCIMIGRISRSE